MTLHKSKGLEFDHVFIVGAARAGRSGDSPLLRWYRDGNKGLMIAAKPQSERRFGLRLPWVFEQGTRAARAHPPLLRWRHSRKTFLHNNGDSKIGQAWPPAETRLSGLDSANGWNNGPL